MDTRNEYTKGTSFLLFGNECKWSEHLNVYITLHFIISINKPNSLITLQTWKCGRVPAECDVSISMRVELDITLSMSEIVFISYFTFTVSTWFTIKGANLPHLKAFIGDIVTILRQKPSLKCFFFFPFHPFSLQHLGATWLPACVCRDANSEFAKQRERSATCFQGGQRPPYDWHTRPLSSSNDHDQHVIYWLKVFLDFSAAVIITT